MVITWRRARETDFPLLRTWLEQPHVARWWNHETSAEAVARDFGPAARGEEPSEDFLALLDGEPLGLVQRPRRPAPLIPRRGAGEQVRHGSPEQPRAAASP
ncbi:GNAT family N-acetyltransferase [Nonomuraea aridisoli]|uniref:GNAT family N-acetyltransferase n=1 Tax=Nonomuraea aridisoli TaxID=2070368 RepID=UPI001C64E7EC|nr:GNAT family N-acetyltransferase [Nonomuraea aridisoli]